MDLDGLKILYIEDSLDDQIILEEHLKSSVNIDVFKTCTSLQKSVNDMLMIDFDLIFLDLSLPDVQGIEGIEKTIKLTSGLVPIIVVTGLNDQKIALKALNSGAQDYLVKGEFNSAVLNKVVRYAIERHRFKQELIQKNDEITISKIRLDKAEQMADIGSWEVELISQTVKLSHGMKMLLLLKAKNDIFSLNEFLSFLHPSENSLDLSSIINSKSPEPAIFEASFVRTNGEVIETFCKTEVAKVVDETKLIVYGVTRDVTEQKEAEKIIENYTNKLSTQVEERTKELELTKIQLEKALSKEKELSELKSRFVSTASHQFRTPLTVIQSNIGLLEMYKPKINKELSPIINKISNRITSEVERMTNIMNEVLILGKINSGEISPKFQETDIVAVCIEIIEKHNEIQEDGRFTKVKVNGNMEHYNIDKSHLEHIISNLVSNAFKYSHGKKSPVVKITFENNFATIEVEDFGMGIPEDELKRLFTPFYRATNAIDIPGNGLGTTIIKEYVELNNGNVSVESTLGKGTKFTIQFRK